MRSTGCKGVPMGGSKKTYYCFFRHVEYDGERATEMLHWPRFLLNDSGVNLMQSRTFRSALLYLWSVEQPLNGKGVACGWRCDKN